MNAHRTYKAPPGNYCGYPPLDTAASVAKVLVQENTSIFQNKIILQLGYLQQTRHSYSSIYRKTINMGLIRIFYKDNIRKKHQPEI